MTLSRLLPATMALLAVVAVSSATDTSTLTTAGAVHALSQQEAEDGHPVHLRGVVTYFDSRTRDVFINDATGGVWMRWEPRFAKPAPGDLIELTGHTSFTFASDVSVAHWKIIGQAPFLQRNRSPTTR